MKGVPEEEEEGEEVWSSLTTPPPKLPCTLMIKEGQQEDGEEEWCIPEPPDGGWGWVVVVASFCCNLVVDGIAYSFGIFLSHFVDYYGAPKGRTAWVGSLLTGCYLSAGPVVSALTNKFGCRPVTISGSLISCAAFLLSTAAPTVDVLMLTYGIMAGVGFGLIYLPAIVSVGFYFSTKRAMATGIAMCGSGMGAFLFAPLAQCLLREYGDWKGAMLIMAGMALNCAVFGALMRPLQPQRHRQPTAEDNREKADGAPIVPAVKVPQLNTEPGVQSTLNLLEEGRKLLPSLKTPEDPLRCSADAVPNLVVTEAPSGGGSTQHVEGASLGALVEEKPPQPTSLIKLTHINVKELQRRFTMPATLPAASTQTLSSPNPHYGGLPRGSSPAGPRGGARRRMSSKTRDLARPLYRKDIFYSGSIANLPEYRQSRADIRCYMASVTTIPRDDADGEASSEAGQPDRRRRCPRLPKSMSHTLREVLDFSLLGEPAFLLACVANVLGMMGFYVPFVYITDSSVQKGVGAEAAAFLLSVIGITNLAGRLLFGWLVDRSGVRALDVNNACLAISGISTLTVPFCYSYASIVVACTFFSVFVSAYISLTSIILVEMVGLDKLTNSFGLLSLFRGAASIVGPPIAGSVYDWTGSYDIPFYFAGALLMLSGLCTFFIPWLNKKKPADLREPTTAL